MSTLYISNIGSEIHIDMDDIHLRYLGPKSLERFLHINKFDGRVIYVETKFSHGIEEDYIDIADVLSDYNYNIQACLKQITDIQIKQKEGNRCMNKIEKSLTKRAIGSKRIDLINRALMVSDNIALIPHMGSARDFQIEAVSMADTNKRSLIRFSDTAILSSNMSVSLQARSIDAVKRNYDLILDIAKEKLRHA